RRHTRSKRDWSSDVCSSDLSLAWSNLSSAFSFASPNFSCAFPFTCSAFAESAISDHWFILLLFLSLSLSFFWLFLLFYFYSFLFHLSLFVNYKDQLPFFINFPVTLFL